MRPPSGGMIGASLGAALIATAAVAQTAAPPPPKTQDFVTGASQSDQYEIMAGQTVETQSRDPRVRAFAEEMIRDHTQTTQALRQAVMTSGLKPPPEGMGGDQAMLLSSLQSLRGADLDRAYATQQVIAHQAALVLAQAYASAGADANVRRAAEAAAPMIGHHLQEAKELRSALGGE